MNSKQKPTIYIYWSSDPALPARLAINHVTIKRGHREDIEKIAESIEDALNVLGIKYELIIKEIG